MPTLFNSINPTTEEKWQSFEGHALQEINQKLDHAVKAQHSWKSFSFAERKKVMLKVARVLRRKKNYFAQLMTQEMGKPITQSLAEVEKCAWACEHFALNAEKYLQPKVVKTEARKSYVSFEPLGIVLGIMPWNYPFWQVFRFAAPTLMAGNGIVLKHASNVPGCAIEIESIFRDAGVPRGLFTTLLIDSRTALDLIADKRIEAVSLTGSTGAGRKVAEHVGKAIKRSVLELGGSDPFIVLEDVNVQECAQSAVQGRIVNGGQSCIASKRFIVPKKISNEFQKHMAISFKELIVGDPLNKNTQVGPLARSDLRENLMGQMKRSIRMGAKVVVRGQAPRGKGFFFAPTLLGKIKPTMPVFSEETFGPLAGVMTVENVREAIAFANASEYGLGASIWSNDISKAEKIAQQIVAGNVFVNTKVASDPRLPFGGAKRSGWGKELGEMGIKEFVLAKTIWIK